MSHKFDIVRETIFTERSTVLAEKENTYTFRVLARANKLEIKQAVEAAFHVKVAGVRIITVHPKRKLDRQRGITGRSPGYKKAMVKLAQGYSIEFA
ncbi:MAG: 50S ribosomal protein L23 [bacterium]